ncbi:TMEM165/GDT1 family protein [Phormidium sp. CLA17]|uniref:TMEM165/GDT1 family protein n=1 Tax=Leptolyngbya sp. Cla-17 TaxID=2803751 RepID=UPI0014913989|nr:TMEM165/GDT1 family protein [Leptolyngbya sp. Cla-17]MBM0741175.1 TMEM165/GDT1 family protein [Leptolyngbya sp. Cla-17]
MDWHLLGLTFITVFISELGDKSQLAAIALSSGSKSPRPVFFGAAAALLLASFLGVIIGEGTSHFLPARLVKIIAAAGFAILAVRMLIPARIVQDEASPEDNSTPTPLKS